MFKTKYSQMYSVFYKNKVFTKIFSIKTFFKKATNLKPFCNSTLGVGKIARGRGSGQWRS